MIKFNFTLGELEDELTLMQVSKSFREYCLYAYVVGLRIENPETFINLCAWFVDNDRSLGDDGTSDDEKAGETDM